MKMTYKTQLIATVVIVILANGVADVFNHWSYRSIGFIMCGLLWIIHPVLQNSAEVSKKTLLWVRIAGVILILIGIFSRVHY